MHGGRGDLELRTYTFLDRMQPQYAAFIGTVVNGDVPIAGMAQLFIEVAPGNAIFRVADVALKSADVRPGVQIVEREFGVLEIHSISLEAVRAAGEAVLDDLGLEESSRIKPTVVSSQVITNVDPYQAQLINKFRRGAMLVPGQTMLVLETSPAARDRARDLKVDLFTSAVPTHTPPPMEMAGEGVIQGRIVGTPEIQAAIDAGLRTVSVVRGAWVTRSARHLAEQSGVTINASD